MNVLSQVLECQLSSLKLEDPVLGCQLSSLKLEEYVPFGSIVGCDNTYRPCNDLPK
jgi:hypothetical protein